MYLENCIDIYIMYVSCACGYVLFFRHILIHIMIYPMPEMLFVDRTSVVKCADVSLAGVACRAKQADSNDVLGAK